MCRREVPTVPSFPKIHPENLKVCGGLIDRHISKRAAHNLGFRSRSKSDTICDDPCFIKPQWEMQTASYLGHDVDYIRRRSGGMEGRDRAMIGPCCCARSTHCARTSGVHDFSEGHFCARKVGGPFALASNFLRLFPLPPDDHRVTKRSYLQGERHPRRR